MAGRIELPVHISLLNSSQKASRYATRRQINSVDGSIAAFIRCNKEGWYLYNDMWNNGKAEFVGKQPQVKKPCHMYIMLFEKSQVNLTSGSKDHAASMRNLMSVAFQNSITPDTKQVKQNYLNILKSAAIHIKQGAEGHIAGK